MGKIVNLRQARKRKLRAEARQTATENASRTGLGKAERQRRDADENRLTKHLDGHKRNSDRHTTDDHT